MLHRLLEPSDDVENEEIVLNIRFSWRVSLRIERRQSIADPAAKQGQSRSSTRNILTLRAGRSIYSGRASTTLILLEQKLEACYEK